MKHYIKFLFFIFTLHLYPNEGLSHLKIKITLKVSSPEIVRKNLLNYVNQKKGYLKNFDNISITLVFPNRVNKEEIISYIKTLGTIVNQSLKTEEYNDEILKLQTKIKVKEKYLNELNQLTGEANLLQTLDMEREISKVIEELEELKGSYNYYLELSTTQEVMIRFTFIDASTIPMISAPGWIETIGIFNFLQFFRKDISYNKSHKEIHPILLNFSKYHYNDFFLEKYITADGIALGVRKVKNDPKAEKNSIWEESVIYFLEGNGYLIKEKKILGDFHYTLSEGTTKEEKFVYGIAFKINENDKDTLTLIEFGGAEKNFNKYKEEIQKFIQNYKKKLNLLILPLLVK